MYPGLPHGSQFRCANYAYSDIAKIKYDDVVAFRHNWQGQEYTFVWRVMALPGDRVVTKARDVYINQQPVKHSIVRREKNYDIYQERNNKAEYLVAFSKRKELNGPESDLIIPEGHVFLMGDNRFDALDSRILGVIPFEEIVCKKM